MTADYARKYPCGSPRNGFGLNEGKLGTMRLVRTILALAIALSLALLPVGASATGLAISSNKSQSSMHTGMQMGASDMSMDDCCPDGMKGMPSHTDSYKCSMGFCCVGGAIALGDVDAAGFGFLPVSGSEVAIPVDQVLSAISGSPPFRPPRV